MQLRSSDGQLYELSDAAARQSVTLQDLAEHVGDEAPVKVDVLDSGRLQRITALLKQTAKAFGLNGMADERRDALLKNGLPCGDMGPQLRAATAAALEGVDGLADFATLLLDLKWFDAPLLTSVLAEGVARLLKGKSAGALRTLLEADDDLGDQEKEAALREPLFAAVPAAVPAAAAPPPLTGVWLAMDGGATDEGNVTACLKRCDVQTLRQLKAVSAGWQQRASRALWGRLLDRLCSRQSPRPQCLDDVEELDVEEFPHEAVAAVRSVPNLARLRGYGFRVELKGPKGVRQAALNGTMDGKKSEDSLRAALCGCIHDGEGGPPRELLLAAVACAARGKVLEVPVQRLREDDAIGRLDLDGDQRSGSIGVLGAELLGLMLPAATSVRELSLTQNRLCGESAMDNFLRGRGATYTTEGITKLCEGLKGSAVTWLDLETNNLGPKGAAALAEGLKGNSTLQSLYIPSNRIGAEGASALAAILKETMISNLDLSENRLGSEGGAALAEGLKGITTMQSLNLFDNNIGAKGASALAAVLKETRISKLRLGNNQLCGVDSYGNGTYTAEGITKLCEALKGSAVTSLDIGRNEIGDKGASALAAILKETKITTLGLADNQLCGINWEGRGTYTSKGITKLCEGLKESAVTSLNIADNGIGDKGASALAAILKETQITTLNLRDNPFGPEGGAALAKGLKGNSTLQLLDLRGNGLRKEAKQALKDAAGSSVRIRF